MKPKSVSAFVCYVQDLDATAAFYEKLGFRLGKRTDKSITFYLNWYWMEFVSITSAKDTEFEKEATSSPKGGGVFFAISVENVDEFYAHVKELGLKPSSEPRTWEWGRREFVLRDPDGYKLVFFEKK